MIRQSKQDKTYSRTAEDLERKYNLGQLAQGGSSDLKKIEALIENALRDAKRYTNEKITELVNGDFDVSGISDDDLEGESRIDELQSQLDIVSELANANKLAQEANASAIITMQEELEGVTERVTTLEEVQENYTEATSLDINSLYY